MSRTNVVNAGLCCEVELPTFKGFKYKGEMINIKPLVLHSENELGYISVLEDGTIGVEGMQTERKNIMNTRRVVQIQLIDEDAGLPVESSLVASFKDVITEDNDSITIQEIIMKEDVKVLLDKHNDKRKSIINEDILNRTGNEVKLRPVKLKDLKWTVL